MCFCLPFNLLLQIETTFRNPTREVPEVEVMLTFRARTVVLSVVQVDHTGGPRVISSGPQRFPWILDKNFTDLCADMGWLQHNCNRLRLLATCSITITNKQNHNVIDYDYIESNHDYNRDYNCLETYSERKQPHLHSLMLSIFSDNIRYKWMQ